MRLEVSCQDEPTEKAVNIFDELGFGTLRLQFVCRAVSLCADTDHLVLFQ